MRDSLSVMLSSLGNTTNLKEMTENYNTYQTFYPNYCPKCQSLENEEFMVLKEENVLGLGPLPRNRKIPGHETAGECQRVLQVRSRSSDIPFLHETNTELKIALLYNNSKTIKI